MVGEDALDYYEMIKVLKAEEFFDLVNISTWPHMSKGDRAKLHNSKMKEAGYTKSQKAYTAQDLAKIIGK